jgi:hypothetical protein
MIADRLEASPNTVWIPAGVLQQPATAVERVTRIELA